MVVTGGPRGHGSGRAKSPEAERERRAKIRTAVLLRKRRVHIEVFAGYRLIGARKRGGTNRYSRFWNYNPGRVYRLYIPEDISNSSDGVREFLDERYPIRQHFNVRIEYLGDSE